LKAREVRGNRNKKGKSKKASKVAFKRVDECKAHLLSKTVMSSSKTPLT
jgi:hypothetical protein